MGLYKRLYKRLKAIEEQVVASSSVAKLMQHKYRVKTIIETEKIGIPIYDVDQRSLIWLCEIEMKLKTKMNLNVLHVLTLCICFGQVNYYYHQYYRRTNHWPLFYKSAIHTFRYTPERSNPPMKREMVCKNRFLIELMVSAINFLPILWSLLKKTQTMSIPWNG